MKDLISANLTRLRGRIANACELYNRDIHDITVIAVSKTHPARVIQHAVAVGLHDIGESRIQEAEPKIKELGPIVRYHMVGHLQSNKAGKAVELFDVIQSVDSLKLAKEISRHAVELGRTIDCLIQVNSSGEESKHGLAPEETADLIGQVDSLPGIKLTGLMTIGPYTEDETEIRSAFATCRVLYQKGQAMLGRQFNCLCMGMSGDFQWGIAEGSTMIRIGTAIFGSRQF